MTIRAHFDGSVIVPDEPVNLPVDRPLEVDVREPVAGAAADEELSAKLTALKRIVTRARKRTGAPIPDAALRRENMYSDDGR